MKLKDLEILEVRGTSILFLGCIPFVIGNIFCHVNEVDMPPVLLSILKWFLISYCFFMVGIIICWVLLCAWGKEENE